jgi:hypothetical protein
MLRVSVQIRRTETGREQRNLPPVGVCSGRRASCRTKRHLCFVKESRCKVGTTCTRCAREWHTSHRTDANSARPTASRTPLASKLGVRDSNISRGLNAFKCYHALADPPSKERWHRLWPVRHSVFRTHVYGQKHDLETKKLSRQQTREERVSHVQVLSHYLRQDAAKIPSYILPANVLP